MLGISLAIAMTVATAATSLPGHAGSSSELTAVNLSDAVLVSFTLHAENYEDLDLRLSRRGVTVVSWAIELRRKDRLGWFDRLWANATIRVFARPFDKDKFWISRSVNGQLTDSGILVDRQAAHGWLTSFSDVPLFERFQLARDADHVLAIRATVEGGGENTVVTPILARSRLSR